MRRYNTIMVLAMISLFLTTQLFAAGIDLTGMGARAQAMGGNYRAISDDWSALFWNPAGMAFTNGWTAGFSSELIGVNVGYTPGMYNGMPFSVVNTTETENEPKTYVVPSGGLYYSTGNMAFGLGVWAPFGLGAKWDLMNTSNYNSLYPKYDYDDDLMVIVVQPTFAYKLSDKLSVGLGVGLVSASIKIEKPTFTRNPLFAYNNPAAPLYSLLDGTDSFNSNFNHIITDTKLDGDGMGFTANIGLMYKATECLTIGASMQYYSTISLDGTVDATTYYPNNVANLKPTLDAALNGGLIDLATYKTLLGAYSGTAQNLHNGLKVKADMPLPTRIGLGVAWTGIENLIVSADVAYSQWSTWDVIDIKDASIDTSVSQLSENWEDGVRFGVGAEYDFGVLAARAAWYTEPNAAVPSTMTPSIPDFNRRHSLMLGVGVPFGPLVLHASFEKILVGDETVSDAEWNYNTEYKGYDNLAGEYDMNINIVMFGLDYRF